MGTLELAGLELHGGGANIGICDKLTHFLQPAVSRWHKLQQLPRYICSLCRPPAGTSPGWSAVASKFWPAGVDCDCAHPRRFPHFSLGPLPPLFSNAQQTDTPFISTPSQNSMKMTWRNAEGTNPRDRGNRRLPKPRDAPQSLEAGKQMVEW